MTCHVISRPRPSKMSTSVTSNVTTCPLCSVSLASVRSYVSHIRLSHYKDTDLDLTCNIDGCTAVFNTFSAFNSHVYRTHRNSLQLSSTRSNRSFSTESSNAYFDCGQQVWQGDTSTLHTNSDLHVHSGYLDSYPPTRLEIEQTDHKKKLATFLLKLSQSHHLSHNGISDVIKGSQDQYDAMSASITSLIAARMAAQGISEDVIADVCSIEDLLPKPFAGLETTYLLEKYCKEHFPYIVSL